MTLMNSFSVSNYKCFRDECSISLRPITILIGPNSSGKTSLLQSLLLIKQTIEASYSFSPLVLKGNYIDLGWFRDISYQHSDNSEIVIGFTIKRLPARLYGRANHSRMGGIDEIELSNVNIKICFKFTKHKKAIYINSYSMHDTDNIIQLSFDRILKYYNYQFSINYEKRNMTEIGRSTIIFANIFAPYINAFSLHELLGHRDIYEYNIARTYRHLMNILNKTVRKMFRFFYYIGPLREPPQRYYEASGEEPNYVGLKGEYSHLLLYLEKLLKKPRRKIISQINKWLVTSSLNSEIRLDLFSENLYRLRVDDHIINASSNISDYGFGLSQLLPIVVQSIFSEENSMIAIEQPELHLNPKIQAELADLFIEQSKRSTFIIETHSEHIISRIQRRIAEGSINVEDVAIYYFTRKGRQNQIKKLEITSQGHIPNWPSGFMEDVYLDRKNQLKAIFEKHHG